jgi:cytochrome b
MSAVAFRDSADSASKTPTLLHAVEIWDLPLRLFHWLLALAIPAAFVTGKYGSSEWAEWHGRIGAFVLGLLIFRVLWGFIGTHNARFRNFLPTPARVVQYVRGHWQGHGHSPLGALAVIALLGLVAAQVGTGLFANDDISFQGPLASTVAKSTSDALSGWHGLVFDVLAILIGVHIAAIAFYYWGRRSNLVRPMVTGKKLVSVSAHVAPSQFILWRFAGAVLIATVIAVAVFEQRSAAHAEAVPVPAASAW